VDPNGTHACQELNFEKHGKGSKFEYNKKAQFAVELVDLYHRLSQLRADSCGAVYHEHSTIHGYSLIVSTRFAIATGLYDIGPLQDGGLLQYDVLVPSPSQTVPVCTTVDHVRLHAYNGLPSTRSSCDKPTRDKVVELFQGLHNLYPRHPPFGPSADPFIFRFSHGDLHSQNILIDPSAQTRLLESSTRNAQGFVLGGLIDRCWMASRRSRAILIRDISSEKFCQ
jgi:hypothetical protein